jgi:hypothetical protein
MSQAQRYEDLAAYARDSGFREVRAPAVHHWVKRGLLPKAEPHHYAQSARAVSYPVHTGRQLLALCVLRFDHKIRNLDVLGSRLWFEGYEVSGTAIRHGLRHAGDLSRAVRAGRTLTARRGDPAPTSSEAVGTFAEAVVFDAAQTSGLVPRPADAADLVVGLSDYLGWALGAESQPADRAGQLALGRVAGLTTSDSETLAEIARHWDPVNVVAALELATDEEIVAARAIARRAAAALDEATDLPAVVALVKRADLGILIALAFLVLRETDLAATALQAEIEAADHGETGAPALRFS